MKGDQKEFSSARNQMEKEIREAYIFLREKNHKMPSETLQFMLDASLEKLNKGFKEMNSPRRQEINYIAIDDMEEEPTRKQKAFYERTLRKLIKLIDQEDGNHDAEIKRLADIAEEYENQHFK